MVLKQCTFEMNNPFRVKSLSHINVNTRKTDCKTDLIKTYPDYLMTLTL